MPVPSDTMDTQENMFLLCFLLRNLLKIITQISLFTMKSNASYNIKKLLIKTHFLKRIMNFGTEDSRFNIYLKNLPQIREVPSGLMAVGFFFIQKKIAGNG